jgi:hypothetical protein
LGRRRRRRRRNRIDRKMGVMDIVGFTPSRQGARASERESERASECVRERADGREREGMRSL